MSINEKIQSLIDSENIVLFMKGSEQFPMCGFSGKVVKLLKECGAQFLTVDVLQDPELREGIKAFSDWPTIPQLYVRGDFIGGCDIVKDMYKAGELQELVG